MFDDIRVQAGNRQIWRRDYAAGSVLVNATPLSQTVALGGPLRRIAGTQAPLVNDGALVTSVVLPPNDGLILVRQRQTTLMLPMIRR